MREFSSSSHVFATLPVHRRGMTPWLKALIALALVVPMTAYVAVSLSSSGAGEPADRGPVIIHDPPSPTAPASRRPRRTPGPSAPGSSSLPPTSPPPATSSVPPTARVVTPQPTAVDDPDDADDGSGDDGGDDDSRGGDDADDRDD